MSGILLVPLHMIDHPTVIQIALDYEMVITGLPEGTTGTKADVIIIDDLSEVLSGKLDMKDTTYIDKPEQPKHYQNINKRSTFKRRNK